MKIAIDASNLLDGGGVTHMKELLNVFKTHRDIHFTMMVGSRSAFESYAGDNITFEKIDSFDKNVFVRNYWMYSKSKKWLTERKIDILFNPGGGYVGKFKPYVTMSRNMLIFQKEERALFGFSKMYLKLKLLEFVHTYSLKRADGIIFISQFARTYISKKIKYLAASVNINHGVSNSFEVENKEQYPVEHYTPEAPFKFIYVSIIDVYKHQCEIAEAIARLRNEGYFVEITFVGRAYPPALHKYTQKVETLDPERNFLHYIGMKPYDELNKYYSDSDAIIFGSSCENMPNILIEGMKTGLPVACSDRPPMPEFLKDAGFYFDPYDAFSILFSLKQMLDNPRERKEKSMKSKKYASEYSWTKCGEETINFIRQIKLKVQ